MVKRLTIDLWKKQEVIELIEKESGGVPSRAARHYLAQGWKLDSGSVRKWRRMRDKSMAVDPRSRRLPGRGHKLLSDSMKENLHNEGMRKRLQKEKMTRWWIASMARVLHAAEATTDQDDDNNSPITFAASQHRVSNFMKHFGMSLHRRTNLTTLTVDVLVSRAVSYMLFLSQSKVRMEYSSTISMDKRAIYFEDARPRSVDVTARATSAFDPQLSHR